MRFRDLGIQMCGIGPEVEDFLGHGICQQTAWIEWTNDFRLSPLPLFSFGH
jgi:hypothetical protein